MYTDEFVSKVLNKVTFKPDYEFEVEDLSGSLVRFRVKHLRPDAITGVIGFGYGGWKYVTNFDTEDSVVRSAFAAYLAYEEHECREFFLYNRKRVFGPHISIAALASIADEIN